MQLDIGRKRAEHKPGKPADGKRNTNDSAKRERGLNLNGAFVHGGKPVENLDGAWYGHEKCKERKIMPAVSLWPLTYMWWPQTSDPTLAMAMLEKAIIL